MRLFLPLILLLSIILPHPYGCPESCICTTESVDDLLDPFVDCSYRDLTSIPEVIPSNTTHLDLRGNRISYLPYGAFGTLRDLVFLDLSGNGIGDITDGAFTNLTQLEILRLHYNKITNFEADILSGLLSLRTLEVYDAGISTLGSSVFRGLNSIEDIDLSYNRIRTVDSHTFVNLPALSKVSLRHNRISKIQLAAFMGLHNFTYLHLSDNKLKYVREGAIIDVPNLKTVFLFGNLLVCDCDAIWLYEFLRNRSLNTAFCEKPGAVAGKRLSAISRLEFCGGPEFYVHPMPVRYARAGQTIVLICGAIGSPDPQIFWSFEKTPIIDSVRHEVTHSGDLVIRNARYSDSGTYHCTASSKVGAIAASAEVIIGDRPQFNQLLSGGVRRLGEVGAAIGGTTVIRCPLEASPYPEYVWRFEGMEIDLSDERFLRTEDGTLVIVNVRESDFGRYLCLAENFLGMAIYETDLIELKKPTVETPLHNWLAPSQTNISLYCDVRGYLSPSLSWYRDGVLLARNGIVVDSMTTEAPVTATPHFVITSHVNITGNNTKNETDEEGSGMLIDTLKPMEPTVMSLDDLRGRLEVRQETLVIVEALESDSGLYECHGVNQMGSASSSAYVLIGDVGDPTVSTSPKDLRIRSGETAFLYCNVTGYPDPTVKWTFNDHTIYDDGIWRFVSPDNTLVVTEVQPFDEGYYDCHAENIAGYDSDSLYLTVESLPKFFELSNHTSVTGSESILLHCVLDRTVKPPAKLTWYFDGKRLPDESLPRHQPVADGHLQIIEVEGSDAGLYSCKAENSAGIISHSFTLDVHVPVKISKGPTKTRSVLGSTAVFTCHADGIPTPTIEWQINGMPVTNTSDRYVTHDDLGVLTIIAVNRSDDESVVSCIASAANQSVIAHARLEVQVPPLVVKEVGDSVFSKGSMGRLTCAFDGNPEPEVKWQKDGKDLLKNPRYRITFGVFSILTISRLKAKDIGKYTCIASSRIGSVSSSGTVAVQAVPVAKGEPFSEEILPIGRTAAFPCIATGLPKPMIEWGRGMAPLPDDPRYSVAKDGSLVIRDVKLDDRGEFICIATNAAGSMIVTTAKLDVQNGFSHPYISVCPLPQTVRLNQEANFECSASGSPLPTIRWLHNGVAITNGVGGFNVTENGTLTIMNVTMSHTGEMTCVAENTEGNDSFVTSLTVTVPPTFTKEPNHTRQAVGSDAVFQCSADGVPKPTILWTNSSFQELPFDDMRYFRLKDGGLLIRNVKKSDEGLYVCEGVNTLGRIMRTAELLVEGDSVNGTDDQLPKINWTTWPKNITIPEGRTAVFHCIVTSFPPATYVWSFSGSLLRGETTTNKFTTVNGSLVIGNVDYTAEGAYTCIASNGVMHLQHTVYLKTLIPPYIYYPPLSQVLHWTVLQDGDNSAEFSCEASGYPTPTIEWVKDHRHIQDSRFTVTVKGHMTIKPLAFEDAGDYTCVATNSAGVARKTASLLIQDNRPRDYCYPTVIYHHVRYRNCRTERKVDNFKCEGYCFSQEYPDAVRPSTEQKHCCQVHTVLMRNVKMLCPNNVTTTVRLPKVKECKCAVCHGSETTDLPVNEYD